MPEHTNCGILALPEGERKPEYLCTPDDADGLLERGRVGGPVCRFHDRECDPPARRLLESREVGPEVLRPHLAGERPEPVRVGAPLFKHRAEPLVAGVLHETGGGSGRGETEILDHPDQRRRVTVDRRDSLPDAGENPVGDCPSFLVREIRRSVDPGKGSRYGAGTRHLLPRRQERLITAWLAHTEEDPVYPGKERDQIVE